nr:Myb-like protein L [Ipomoea batatas]
MLFGPKTWRKIAQYVPGRTHVQCRERWVNSLDPSLNLNQWTEEEDLKLEAAIQEHGYSWSKVAACVAPRIDSQCRRRWKALFPHEVPLLLEARKILKLAIIANFVDRESERPSLKPDDFAPAPLLLQPSGSEPSRKWKIASSNMSSDDPTIAENCRYGITYQSRRSKRQPKRKICTNRRRRCPPFANPGMLSDGNELEGLEFSVAMNNRTSKLPPRKKRKREPYVEVPEISASDEIETTNGEGIIFRRSTRGTEFDSGSDNDAKLDSSSSFPNSFSDARTLGGKAIKSRKRKRSIRCPRKKCSDLYVSQGNHPFPTSRKREGPLREFPGSNLDADPSGDSSLSFEENSELESGAKQVEESHDRSSPLRCLAHNGLESNNFRTSSSCMQGKKKGLKCRDVDHSNKLAETEEDDSITLAAFIKKSLRLSSDHNSNENGAILERNIHTPTTSRGCEIQGHGNGLGLGPSPPTSEAGIMDDMPLAHFLNTLKRRVKPATSK